VCVCVCTPAALGCKEDNTSGAHQKNAYANEGQRITIIIALSFY